MMGIEPRWKARFSAPV